MFLTVEQSERKRETPGGGVGWHRKEGLTESPHFPLRAKAISTQGLFLIGPPVGVDDATVVAKKTHTRTQRTDNRGVTVFPGCLSCARPPAPSAKEQRSKGRCCQDQTCSLSNTSTEPSSRLSKRASCSSSASPQEATCPPPCPAPPGES